MRLETIPLYDLAKGLVFPKVSCREKTAAKRTAERIMREMCKKSVQKYAFELLEYNLFTILVGDYSNL